MTLPVPAFYDPRHAAEIYLERTDAVVKAAHEYRRHYHVKPAREDAPRVAALGIDVQVCFAHPQGSLFVPGAVEDTQRTLLWLYRHLDRVTDLFFSLDTHTLHQVFHPAWWVDADGNHPAPFTPISAADVDAGRWRPTREVAATVEYVHRLESGGKYMLTIWPYHALVGGLGHALVPAMMEAALFHDIVRDTQSTFEIKGREPRTENYSILSPEVRELAGEAIGEFNEAFFQKLMGYDRIYVFGQAKSHCVLSTLLDLKARIETVDASMLKKVYVLEDAMSPVPAPPIEPLPPELDFPKVAGHAFAKLAQAGMNIVTTEQPIG